MRAAYYDGPRKPMAFYLIEQGEPDDVISDALSIPKEVVQFWRGEVKKAVKANKGLLNYERNELNDY